MTADTETTSIRRRFAARFGVAAQWVVRAPGRVNLVGDHTDHNDGFVLPMAIAKRTLLAAVSGPNRTAHRIRAYSVDLDQFDEFVIGSTPLESTGRWTDYIKGVFEQFLTRGLPPQSLDIMVETDIPIGCGLSSSAALQIAVARLLQHLAPGLVNDQAVAALCQQAEHDFSGTPVGIMDQFCIANAQQGRLMYLDCRSLQARHVTLDDDDVVVMIVDSKLNRELRSGAYARRRAQCSEACRVLGVSHLRDVTMAQVEKAKGELGDVNFRRARHVVTENARTTASVTAIEERDWLRLGELMYSSHRSLSLDFETSVKDMDTLVALALDLGTSHGVFGARMTGGGFGGCMVMLVERAQADTIGAALSETYAAATGHQLVAYASFPAAGAQLIVE